MILGGEVDCVREGAGIKEGLETQDFIELKTNLVIESTRDEMNFERLVSASSAITTVSDSSGPNRYKLLKHYTQSCKL